METLTILGDGSLLKGLLTLPFAINGLRLVVKGVLAYLDEIDGKYALAKGWKVSLGGTIILFSYLSFFYAVALLL